MRKISVLFFILLNFFLHAGFLKAETKTPANFLLTKEAPAASPYYKKMLEPGISNPEKIKMQYLIDRIRRSEYTFMRNGVSYPAGRAAIHITWKMQRKGSRIKTARQFIDEIASNSSMSGAEYLVIVEKDITYPMHDVLSNELELLETKIEHSSSVDPSS